MLQGWAACPRACRNKCRSGGCCFICRSGRLRGDEVPDMRSQETNRDRAREFRRFEAEQRNAALATKLLRANSNYDPFWNISPRAPLVQRVGAGVLGLFFLSIGGCFFYMGLEDHSWALFAASLFALLISVRPIWNAFKGRKTEPAPRNGSTRE